MKHTFQINSLSAYNLAYKKSVEEPEIFWAEVADSFQWHKQWDNVLKWDFKKPEIIWFEGAKLNITENCLDRYLKTQPDKIAILWEPNNPGEPSREISYKELFEDVCVFASVLTNMGIQKGDRVCIYLPMIPEVSIAMLACARIGAIHSVVFAGFSSKAIASRINDANCKILITANEMYRGEKTINLKNICDEALTDCPSIENVIVYKRTSASVNMKENRDFFWDEEVRINSENCDSEYNEATKMDAEDPLFILYTSGSTGKPKGMVHTTAGYMVGATYTLVNVFQLKEDSIWWCSADVGWITGHSYIVYGPLLAGATSVMFEGVPSYPDYDRFWQIIEKYKVTQFYTAPTAIRALAKQHISHTQKNDLSSLHVLGTVGEPINEEAWQWYHKNIGKEKTPITDTWFQTENGVIMISGIAGITESIPTYASLPLPGVQTVLMDDNSNEIKTTKAEGRLAIKFPWPSIARTIWGDHERFKKTYFSTFENMYFTGDGALRDENGNYRITGRVDDIVIVSGHNMGTAPIENSINEHKKVVESAVVGFPHDIKGNALFGFVILYDIEDASEELKKEINEIISSEIGAFSKLEKIQFVENLPKTRSGKIMRRILRKIAEGKFDEFGDTSTLLNPEIVEEIVNRLNK